MIRILFGVIVVCLALVIRNVAFAPDPLGRGSYKVVQREQPDPDCITCSVRLVLLHENRRIHATALNYIGTTAGTRRSNLQVGDTVKCKFFQDRLSEDAGGYDLICGDELWNGRLTTTGGNEMLTIQKEELLP